MPRVLLLLPTTSYRTAAFMEAAEKLGVDIVAASEKASTLQNANPAGLITLDFLDPDKAALDVEAFAKKYPISAIIPVDEDTAVAAARIARQLGLRHNSVESTLAAKNKILMRRALAADGIAAPRFWPFSVDDEPRLIARRVAYPCVVKPAFLSTSRGVIRADSPAEFVAAVERLKRILALPEVRRRQASIERDALAEEYIPGEEVAVEALLTGNSLQTLAIFDKPDPLTGPFFEETIYVTPSRRSFEDQEEIQRTCAAAVQAMGLSHGPIHAEVRINQAGPWIVEIAARPIGGLCSGALRFERGLSLEEIVIAHALGRDVSGVARESLASGVMMIPVPAAGTLASIAGIDAARRVPGVQAIVITARTGQYVQPPPEGAAYLGFIFATADEPEQAEGALREAHSRLEFTIE